MRTAAFLLTVLASSTAYAGGWPSELTYQGKPITRCLETIPMEETSRTQPLSLAECTADNGLQDAEPNQELLNQGFTGRSFTNAEGATAYGYYKVLGPYRGGYLVYGMWSGGGSAQFSSLDVIKRKKDSIWIDREIARGDRCNGGITEAWLERGKLFYKVNFTAYDIVAHADGATTLKASDDLESTPTSCFALATFAQTRENQPEFYVIALNQETDNVISDTNWSRNYRYQPCFNKQFLDTVQAGNISLDKKALTGWVKTFNDVCVNQTTIDAKPLDVKAPEIAPPLDQKVLDILEIPAEDNGVEQTDTPEFQGEAQ